MMTQGLKSLLNPLVIYQKSSSKQGYKQSRYLLQYLTTFNV